MKLTKTVLVMMLAASASLAQAQTAQPQAATAPKANTPAATTQAKPASAVPAKTAKPKATVKRVQVPQQPKVQPAATDSVAEVQGKKVVVARKSNKRDPFVSVIVENVGEVPCLGGGKKCIMPDRVTLQGIVRQGATNIAVVVNRERRTYFLRENDPVFNGVVVRITDESVVFRQEIKDMFGKTVHKEVVKKINTPSV